MKDDAGFGKATTGRADQESQLSGGREMSEAIRLPDVNEIATWLGERCHLERARLRNELAFIHGDRAHGGPPREDLAAALKFRLAAIDKRLDGIT